MFSTRKLKNYLIISLNKDCNNLYGNQVLNELTRTTRIHENWVSAPKPTEAETVAETTFFWPKQAETESEPPIGH